MPLPALAAAGIASAGAGLIGNIIGGVLGKSSQNTANKTNLAIARETNANNYKIAQEANALTHQMMLEQQKYASPLEQRRMLQEAGYNPALYGDSKSMPGGSPTATTGAPQIAPSVIPEDAFASRIGSMSADLSNLVVATSEARKNNAEAQQVEIQNSFESERLTKALEAMGLTNEAQFMRNQFIYSSEQKNLELLASQIGWNEQQITNAQIAYEIEKYKHEKLQPEEYNRLVAEVAKINEETKTEQSLQSYYKTMEEVGIKQAEASQILAAVARYKAPSEVSRNSAEAANLKESAEYQNIRNSIERSFGASTAEALLELYNKQGWLTEEQAKKVLHENGVPDDLLDVGQTVIGAILGSAFGKGAPKPVKGFSSGKKIGF